MKNKLLRIERRMRNLDEKFENVYNYR